MHKSDLAYYYKQCIDGIEEVRRKGWKIFKKYNKLTPKNKLLALKVIRECNEAKFALFKRIAINLSVCEWIYTITVTIKMYNKNFNARLAKMLNKSKIKIKEESNQKYLLKKLVGYEKYYYY